MTSPASHLVRLRLCSATACSLGPDANDEPDFPRNSHGHRLWRRWSLPRPVDSRPLGLEIAPPQEAPSPHRRVAASPSWAGGCCGGRGKGSRACRATGDGWPDGDGCGVWNRGTACCGVWCCWSSRRNLKWPRAPLETDVLRACISNCKLFFFGSFPLASRSLGGCQPWPVLLLPLCFALRSFPSGLALFCLASILFLSPTLRPFGHPTSLPPLSPLPSPLSSSLQAPGQTS